VGRGEQKEKKKVVLVIFFSDKIWLEGVKRSVGVWVVLGVGGV